MQDFSQSEEEHTGTWVVCRDIAGTMDNGEIPQRLGDECRLALERASGELGERGMTLHDTAHFSCYIRDLDGFATCIALIAEALGPARPMMTMRSVNSLPLEGQRLAFMVRATTLTDGSENIA